MIKNKKTCKSVNDNLKRRRTGLSYGHSDPYNPSLNDFLRLSLASLIRIQRTVAINMPQEHIKLFSGAPKNILLDFALFLF